MMIRALALLAAAAAIAPAHAADLLHLRSFPMSGPSGLAYDPQLCALWVASERREVVLVDPWGSQMRRFDAELRRVDAIAIQGDHLLLSDGTGTYQRVSRDGEALGPAHRLTGAASDTDGLFFDERTHATWVTDDTLSQLIRIEADGRVAQRVDGRAQVPQLMEPQGITQDPLSGNLLVVDDAEATDSLFEFSPEGQLLDVIALSAGGWDAEGITIDPASGTLYIAYDDGDSIGVFHYSPTLGDAPAGVPGPGGCAISGYASDRAPV